MASPYGTIRPYDVVESPAATERPTKRARVEATEDKSRIRLNDLPREPEAGGAVQAAREKVSATSGDARQDAPKEKGGPQRAEGAEQVRQPGWRHIGRVPGATDPALTGSDPSSRRPLQLPTEVCERIIDYLWEAGWTLQQCALVCKAWTPRCRYWMQRNVALWDRSQVRGYARRAREQPHLLQQARSVWVESTARLFERAPIPHLGTFAMMGAAKMPLMWRLHIEDAIWKPSDFHPLIFVHLSAFSSVTTLRLIEVTFPKVREFGRLVCALPSLVRLKCHNVLFASTAPCASLAITRCPPSVRLTHLDISSEDSAASDVEANRSLIEHLCAAGVVADLQKFEFTAWASSDNKYLDAYREPVQELLKQCSRSLRNLKVCTSLDERKDLRTDTISDSIASVFNLTCCDSLETVALCAFNFEKVGYAWMWSILESIISKKLREVSIIMDEPEYSLNAEKNLQETISALRRDVCPHLNELLSNQDYEKLCHIDLVLLTHPDGVMLDAARWRTLLEAEMPKLYERGVLRTRVDVHLELWNEDYF